MQVYQIVNVDIPVLKPDSNLDASLKLMLENHLNALPVVEKNIYKGLVTLNDIISALYFGKTKKRKTKTVSSEPTVADIQKSAIKGILHISHVYEVVKAFSDNNADLLPVVDEKNKYIGCILLREINKIIAELLTLNESGSLIEVEFAPYNYSLSELIKTIEENQARVSSLMMMPENSESHRQKITLRLNVLEGSKMVNILERAGYNAKLATDHDVDWSNEIQERAQELLKYLES